MNGRLIALISLAAILGSSMAMADQYVHGYTRRDGTYVQGYYRTTPDGNPWNNYSTVGNVNPYTGKPGTVNPYGSGYSSYYGGGYSGTNTPSSNDYSSGYQQPSYNSGAYGQQSGALYDGTNFDGN